MNTENTIPVVVGVTGHRTIRDADRPAIREAVRAELLKIRALCPRSPLVMLNSLAEGGDLLCADAAEELGIPLLAALPRPREDYSSDFSEEGRALLAHHCGRAAEVFVVPAAEAVPEGGAGRDFQFRQAGIYVASHSHVLLALWDGGPGTEAACGTAEAVDFALNGGYAPLSGVPLRSGKNEAVLHIVTPRGENPAESAGTVHVLGSWENVSEILRKTEDFNRNAGALPDAAGSRLPEDAGGDPILAATEAVSLAAGRLSRRSARVYRSILALLAVVSALLTFAFLMYDEAQANWMILVCGVMLLAALGCRRRAARLDCHRRYIEYRALAECTRVQTYLRYAGSRLRTAELLSWTQRSETAWILCALQALTIGGDPVETHDIRGCWVEDQREYHRTAGARSQRELVSSDRVVHTALILSVCLYVAAVLYELLCGSLLFSPVLPVADAELCRTILKILLGTISAVTLFIANYYGRLSLPRTSADHRKMEEFYGTLSEQLLRRGQTEELLRVLAREELTENGNWSSYQRDNTPDISL